MYKQGIHIYIHACTHTYLLFYTHRITLCIFFCNLHFPLNYRSWTSFSNNTYRFKILKSKSWRKSELYNSRCPCGLQINCCCHGLLHPVSTRYTISFAWARNHHLSLRMTDEPTGIKTFWEQGQYHFHSISTKPSWNLAHDSCLIKINTYITEQK